MINRREYVIPEDIISNVIPVCSHRVVSKNYMHETDGLSTQQIASTRTALTNAERRNGAQRKTALTTLATELEGMAGGSSDQAKVKMLVDAVKDLAK